MKGVKLPTITPQRAAELARLLFPNAFKILVYDAATRDTHTMAGDAVRHRELARIDVWTEQPPRGSYCRAQRATGATLRDALAALCVPGRVPVETEVVDRVRAAIDFLPAGRPLFTPSFAPLSK